MRNPVPAVSHVQTLTETFLPELRPAQQRGVAEWVTGVLGADSGLEQAVLAALTPEGEAAHATRARLREFLCDGDERAAPCQTTLEVEACFAPRLRWVVQWWTGDTLPLAIDATNRHEREVVLSITVLYRRCAIPVAWVVRPHRGHGALLPHLERLLDLLAPAVPAHLTVLVMTDRGLWSPRWWRQIRDNGWHPLLRIRPDATFAPTGERRLRSRELVPGPGGCWVGAGVASKHAPNRIACPLVVVWGRGSKPPGCCSPTCPRPGGGRLVWLAHLDRTRLSRAQERRLGLGTDPPPRPPAHRAALAGAGHRHLAQPGSGHPAGGGRRTRRSRPRTPPPARARARARSVFAKGKGWLHRVVRRGRRGWALWLRPERLPAPPPGLTILRHLPTPGGAHA